MYGLSISPCFFLESAGNPYLVKQAHIVLGSEKESKIQATKQGRGTEMQQGVCSDPQIAQARSSIELSPAFQSQPGTKLTGGPQTPEYAFCGQAALSTQGI